ncbi:unnamed protein product [Effrenium voratum]|nr:unnamed protein product [Effrenium voratum]
MASDGHTCSFCNGTFTSRSKLFQHLRGSGCGAAAGLETRVPLEHVALVVGVARREWRALLWRALDAARANAEPSYAPAGPPGASFASDKDAEDLPKACDVLSLSTEVVPEEARASWCAKANASLPEDIRILGRSGPLPKDFCAARCCIRRYFTCLVPKRLLVDPAGEQNAGYEEPMGETRFGSNRRETLREQFSRLKEILRKFQGEHLFHNFSERALKPKDTLARRFVYRCRAQPQGDQAAADKVALSVAADALAPGQLRAMGGLAVALQWALLPAAYLDAAFSEERLLPLPSLPKDAEFQEACVFGKDVHHLLRCFFESEEAQSFKRKVEEKISGEVLDEVFEKWFQELVPLAQRWRESAAFEGKVPATPSELTEAEPA